MARVSSQGDDRLASLGLAVIDLRAHFEAQLRAVARTEEALLKCRTARHGAAFESAATVLRGEVQVVSHNNRSIRVVIAQMDIDGRELAFSGSK